MAVVIMRETSLPIVEVVGGGIVLRVLRLLSIGILNLRGGMVLFVAGILRVVCLLLCKF